MQITQREQTVYDALERMGIAYERYSIEAASTMDDLADVAALTGVAPCKNLFLCNKHMYCLLMLGASKKFRTAEVSPQVPTSRLSFAPGEKLMEYLGMEGGAISPMGLVNDTGHAVTLLIDEDLRSAGKLCVHPNVNTAVIVLSAADFFEVYLPATGHAPQFVTVSSFLEP